MRTKFVQGVRIVAQPEADHGWKTVHVPARSVCHLGWKSGPLGKELHGRVRHHRVIQNGQPGQIVRVLTCTRGSVFF